MNRAPELASSAGGNYPELAPTPAELVPELQNANASKRERVQSRTRHSLPSWNTLSM
jgi:hypothetical protein